MDTGGSVMKVSEICRYLETFVPLSAAESWDHSGLQLGSPMQEVSSILLALNVDAATISQAIQNGSQMIISHHPFLFQPVQTIDYATIKGDLIRSLVKHDISVYALHTNYDRLRMNRYLLEKIGADQIEAVNIWYKGVLPTPKDPEHLIIQLKDLFDLPYIRVVGSLPQQVLTIGLCAGSGHDYIVDALAHVDVYLTGDLTYTHAMNIQDQKNGAVIELPHFIEAAFKQDVASLLKKYPLKIIEAKEQDYFKIY